MSQTVAIAHLPSRATIAVGGPDWRGFLQGLLTQDVESLATGEARFAALLTPQGRLLYDMFVVGRGEGALLDVEAEHRDALLQRLTMYRLRAKVELAASDLPVCALFPAHPGEGGDSGGPSLESAWVPALAGMSGSKVCDPRLPALGWRVYGGLDADTDEAAYEAHRLALGVPGPADWGTERTYPIEANFDLLNGIDFRKGCFVGQETTSRMKRRGQVKRRMLPIAFDGAAPAFGAEVLAGERRAGEALCGIEGRAMALLRLDRALGVELSVEGRPARAAVPDWMAAAVGEQAA